MLNLACSRPDSAWCSGNLDRCRADSARNVEKLACKVGAEPSLACKSSCLDCNLLSLAHNAHVSACNPVGLLLTPDVRHEYLRFGSNSSMFGS